MVLGPAAGAAGSLPCPPSSAAIVGDTDITALPEAQQPKGTADVDLWSTWLQDEALEVRCVLAWEQSVLLHVLLSVVRATCVKHMPESSQLSLC